MALVIWKIKSAKKKKKKKRTGQKVWVFFFLDGSEHGCFGHKYSPSCSDRGRSSQRDPSKEGYISDFYIVSSTPTWAYFVDWILELLLSEVPCSVTNMHTCRNDVHRFIKRFIFLMS
jgi:hypothetical protein